MLRGEQGGLLWHARPLPSVPTQLGQTIKHSSYDDDDDDDNEECEDQKENEDIG